MGLLKEGTKKKTYSNGSLTPSAFQMRWLHLNKPPTVLPHFIFIFHSTFVSFKVLMDRWKTFPCPLIMSNLI